MIGFVTNCGACCMNSDFSFWPAQTTLAGTINSRSTIPKLFDGEASGNKTWYYETKVQLCGTTMAYTGQCSINEFRSYFSCLQPFLSFICGHKYRGADKSLARPGRKKATATEDFNLHISYLCRSPWPRAC